jgi:hypothetical protein
MRYASLEIALGVDIMAARVVSVHRSPVHAFSKDLAPSIRFLVGLGVEDDAHLGKTVQHRSRVAVDPTQPNLRQVHLIHRELLNELMTEGFVVGPGHLGENVLTEGIDLLGLPRGTILELGQEAAIEVTGLRNPCKQLNQIDSTLLPRLAFRDASGVLVRLAGIMAIVVREGNVSAGDAIQIIMPEKPHENLVPV